MTKPKVFEQQLIFGSMDENERSERSVSFTWPELQILSALLMQQIAANDDSAEVADVIYHQAAHAALHQGTKPSQLFNKLYNTLRTFPQVPSEGVIFLGKPMGGLN